MKRSKYILNDNLLCGTVIVIVIVLVLVAFLFIVASYLNRLVSATVSLMNE